jgi:hypothetical protein
MMAAAQPACAIVGMSLRKQFQSVPEVWHVPVSTHELEMKLPGQPESSKEEVVH